MCSCDDIIFNKRIEIIANRVFNKNFSDYTKDIHTNLKNYIKYDPELITFRNLSIEHYNKILDENTKKNIIKANISINNIFNNKLEEIQKISPVDIIIKSIEPKLNTNQNLTYFSIGLGIANLACLCYLFKK